MTARKMAGNESGELRRRTEETGRKRVGQTNGITEFSARLDGTFGKDDDGTDMCRAVVRGISKPKCAEEAIAESELNYRRLFELELDARLMVDAQSGNIIDANRSAVSLYGYSLEELLRMRHIDLSAEPEETRNTSAVATSSGNIRIPLRYHRKKDGTVFPVEINAVSIMWKGRPTLMPAIRDITERKQAEKVLRTNEERFRRLIEALPMPLVIINDAGEQTYINDRFVQVFGYTFSEIPTREEWQKRAFPDVMYRKWAEKIWITALGQAARTGRDIGPIEYDITCKDGRVRSIIISGITLDDEILVTFIDITDRRQHEKMMKASYERRRKNDIMNELIREGILSTQVVHESARIWGEKTLFPFSCFLMVIEEYQGKTRAYWQENVDEYQRLLDSIIDAVEAENRISWDSPDGIGVLWFTPDGVGTTKDEQKNLAGRLRDIIAEQIPIVELSIGIAVPSSNMSEIRAHYRQANTAVRAGRKVWPQLKTYHYLEIGVFQILSCFDNDTRISEYIELTLGKLLHYGEKRKREEYLNTLEMILSSDNLKEAAKKLSIHYKTMIFRKQRLETILEVSLDEFAPRTAIVTALNLLKLRQQ